MKGQEAGVVIEEFKVLKEDQVMTRFKIWLLM